MSGLEGKVKLSKAERKEADRIRKQMTHLRNAISESDIAMNIEEHQIYHDFFGFLKNETDVETKEWLKNPKNMLLMELYISELLARKGGKRKTMDTHGFETNLFENLVKLRDALWNSYYYPSRGTVHIIFDPVQREIFAAPYVDRVLHHWIVGTLMKWQDKRLIYDSYSCRRNKGTLFGVKRMQHHILSVSNNMKKKAYVVQLDLSGYFMHIKRDVLYDLVKTRINQEFTEGARDKRYKILLWAVGQVIFDDPTKGVRLQGTYHDWEGLPDDKSLMMQPKGQGMVIGNFTSQTFSNIYLDPLDRFIKYNLGYKHYGRYVDDLYLVVTEEQLEKVKRDIKAIEVFLTSYGLRLNQRKTKITEVNQGVEFLGVVIKGFRLFPGKRLVNNFKKAVFLVEAGVKSPEVITSCLGMFSHLDAGKIIKCGFDSVAWDYKYDKKKIYTNREQINMRRGRLTPLGNCNP